MMVLLGMFDVAGAAFTDAARSTVIRTLGKYMLGLETP